jgi:hypothetical protein
MSTEEGTVELVFEVEPRSDRARRELEDSSGGRA